MKRITYRRTALGVTPVRMARHPLGCITPVVAMALGGWALVAVGIAIGRFLIP